MKKTLYASLASCQNEEEVKQGFCNFFKMKIDAARGKIDHYTEQILFEFKHDLNFQKLSYVATVLAQVMYYARKLKFSAGLTRYPLPPIICGINKKQAFFALMKDYKKFYTAKGDCYDWDRAPSTPCPKLVADVLAFLTQRRSGEEKSNQPYIYELSNPAEEEQFVAKCRELLTAQATFLDLLDKKTITEDNFLEVFDYWNSLFGEYVRNGRKSSEYFLADIEQDKSIDQQDGRVLFSVSGAEGYIPKILQPERYHHFWQSYEKVPPSAMARIRQMADRLTEDFRRRFHGEFFTPIPFAIKGLAYIERTVGHDWWKSGEYRLWDMAAGTGNLEFELPSSALPYCYISTLEIEDAEYCRKIFPGATCFQYDYLADDIPALAGQMTFGQTPKMPANLIADLANPNIKWIIFINPPFVTANKRSGGTGKKSKNMVSMTPLREWMNKEDYGEASRELFTQFLFRISKEFRDRQAYLCMFSKLKYLNSNNDQKIRDGFFQYKYERGFTFPSKAFQGPKANFPVGFIVWNLAKRKHLSEQQITLDVFNLSVEKEGTKRIPSVVRTAMLNKWCPRPKWDRKSIMPTFVSAFNLKTDNKDKRNHVAPGFLCSLVSKGDDVQNQRSVCLLSAPYANAGAFSVTPDNFEKAMVLHAVKRNPKAKWTNDKDTFYAPTKELPEEFIADCAVWSAFAESNNCVSLRNVQYKSRVWQIPNQMFPILLDEVRYWPCAHSDIAAQLVVANEDRFLARGFDGHVLSAEAKAVLEAARALYREFYAHITHTPWMDSKIETWDVGIYQIRKALKDAGLAVVELDALTDAHDTLRKKLRPQIYFLGFLNPDVEYYEEVERGEIED